MDFHLERSLRLHTEPDHKSLYSWAINEFDAQGKQIGHDQIPWNWTLYFTAMSGVLSDRIEIEPRFRTDEAALLQSEITQSQVIQLQLRSGDSRDQGKFSRETSFRMFGTDRHIKSFQLSIYPISDPTKIATCTAWGSVSYTAEVDFRDLMFDDCIEFNLFVTPETFARYAAKVSDGLVDEIVFSAGSVAGFYSEWSPSISTDSVKVLTKGDEHKIELPPGFQFEPPRLGDVGSARLYINRRLDFDKPTSDIDGFDDATDDRTALTDSGMKNLAATELRSYIMLASIRRAAWFVVSLLALILVIALFKL
jgi:hypothetical protein